MKKPATNPDYAVPNRRTQLRCNLWIVKWALAAISTIWFGLLVWSRVPVDVLCSETPMRDLPLCETMMAKVHPHFRWVASLSKDVAITHDTAAILAVDPLKMLALHRMMEQVVIEEESLFCVLAGSFVQRLRDIRILRLIFIALAILMLKASCKVPMSVRSCRKENATYSSFAAATAAARCCAATRSLSLWAASAALLSRQTRLMYC